MEWNGMEWNGQLDVRAVMNHDDDICSAARVDYMFYRPIQYNFNSMLLSKYPMQL